MNEPQSSNTQTSQLMRRKGRPRKVVPLRQPEKWLDIDGVPATLEDLKTVEVGSTVEVAVVPSPLKVDMAAETEEALQAAEVPVRYYFRKENVQVARVYRVEGNMPASRAYATVLRIGNGVLPDGIVVAAEMPLRRSGDGPVHEIREGVDDFIARIAAGNWK